jgi:hypothetical protein
LKFRKTAQPEPKEARRISKKVKKPARKNEKQQRKTKENLVTALMGRGPYTSPTSGTH